NRKKIKKHHKKTTEIVDGIPHTVHEFTIQEFEPDAELVPETITEIEDDITPKTQIEDYEIEVSDEQPKRKPKKDKKSKVVVVDQEPVHIEDIGETVEVTKLVEDDGTTKEVQVKKRKIVRKQGPKEHVFEITETSNNDEPLAEVTIIDITEDERPTDTVEPLTKRKAPIKMPKKLNREDVDSYVINVVEDFTEPIEKITPIPSQVLEKTISFEPLLSDDDTEEKESNPFFKFEVIELEPKEMLDTHLPAPHTHTTPPATQAQTHSQDANKPS
ncbi:uncharacterized protein Dvir_GJ26446, partial [Drosophila virilis]